MPIVLPDSAIQFSRCLGYVALGVYLTGFCHTNGAGFALFSKYNLKGREWYGTPVDAAYMRN
jgi:hypothetical protein